MGPSLASLAMAYAAVAMTLKALGQGWDHAGWVQAGMWDAFPLEAIPKLLEECMRALKPEGVHVHGSRTELRTLLNQQSESSGQLIETL